MSRPFPALPALLFMVSLMVPLSGPLAGDETAIGVVSNLKALSDRVPDVSSLEDWKRSHIPTAGRPSAANEPRG